MSGNLLFNPRANGTSYSFRSDAMALIVFELQGSPTLRFIDCATHGVRDFVGVENDFRIDIASGSADGLNQRSSATEKALFVRIQYRNQRDFRQVEAFTQEIHADQHIESSFTQFTQDLDAFDCVQLGVQPFPANSAFLEVGAEILGKSFGESWDKHALLPLGTFLDLFHQIRYLTACGPNVQERIHQSRRANDLFDDLSATPLQLV